MAAAGRGDFQRAIDEFERAKPLVDAAPDETVLAYWHAGIGRFHLGLGDLGAARDHLERARAHFGGAPSWYVGRVLAMLAAVARQKHELEHAAALSTEGLESLRAYGATVEAIGCLEELARLAMDQGDPPRAATLLAAATGLRDSTGALPTVPEREERTRDIERVRSTLRQAEFDAAWRVGLGMTLDEAVSWATGQHAPATTRPATRHGSGLTEREREIAALVALGLTNRQIADRLVIAPGTVKVHVERILGKLGRTSRVQIATWALEQSQVQDRQAKAG
jgi:DNA-binding CsgD family transcriptional regulator